MPLSNAEKVRRYRERQKKKKEAELTVPSAPSRLFRTPFFEFFPVGAQVGSQYCQSLELAGVTPPLFEDDTGPETITLDDLGGDDTFFGEGRGSSLGKAEVLIGCLLSSAAGLASWVNDFKRTEIQLRIAEIKASDLSDPDVRQAAFDQVARLTRMLEAFEKEIRWPLPAWRTPSEES